MLVQKLIALAGGFCVVALSAMRAPAASEDPFSFSNRALRSSGLHAAARSRAVWIVRNSATASAVRRPTSRPSCTTGTAEEGRVSRA